MMTRPFPAFPAFPARSKDPSRVAIAAMLRSILWDKRSIGRSRRVIRPPDHTAKLVRARQGDTEEAKPPLREAPSRCPGARRGKLGHGLPSP